MENRKRDFGALLSLIKYPLLTEKAINLCENQQYTFIVDKSLTKVEIKYVFEKIFNVTILNIKTCNLPLKNKRVGKFLGKKALYKKTYIKLKEGDSIANLFN
jgi:large subunit ribosomal protein L23